MKRICLIALIPILASCTNGSGAKESSVSTSSAESFFSSSSSSSPSEPASFKVSFDSRYDDVVIPAQMITDGQPIMRPDAPTRIDQKTGWTMRVHNWYHLGEPYDFSAPVTGDITIKAIWVLDVPKEACVSATTTVETLKNPHDPSALPHEYVETDCLLYDDGEVSYYILEDFIMVEPNEVENPVCLDGLCIGGKTYLCEYFRGRSHVWKSLTLPETMLYFVDMDTLNNCERLRYLDIPDSAIMAWCDNLNEYTLFVDGFDYFLLNMPSLERIHFGYRFEGMLTMRPYLRENDFGTPALKEVNLSPRMDIGHFVYRIPQYSPNLETITVDEGNNRGFIERYGMVYSPDGSTLVSAPANNPYLIEYGLPDGTRELADYSVSYSEHVVELDLTGVDYVYPFGFSYLPNLHKVWLPKEMAGRLADEFWKQEETWASAPGFRVFTDAADVAKWYMDDDEFWADKVMTNATKADYEAY